MSGTERTVYLGTDRAIEADDRVRTDYYGHTVVGTVFAVDDGHRSVEVYTSERGRGTIPAAFVEFVGR